MNNTLDISRLGKVIKHDAMSFFQNLSLALIVLWAIPVAIWLFSSLTPGDGHMETLSRISIIGTLLKIIIILAPARLYKYCNDSRKGIGYAMLPASSLEKFISMVFYCVIVAPVLYLAGALAVDSVLTLIGGPYEGFAITEYFDKLAQLKHFGVESGFMLDGDYPVYEDYAKILSPTVLVLSNILGLLMLSTVFMFGNMVFKKRKTGKMIGILVLLFIVFMIVMVNYVSNHEQYFQQMCEENAAAFFKRLIYFTSRASLVIEAVVSVVMLWLTYYKIKTQKY